MTRKSLMLLAAFGSALLLAGAFAFQHLGGLAPCQLCLWQRWPHAAAIALGALALVWPAAVVALAGAAAAAATGAIGVYHTGVERGWWEGATACSAPGGGVGGLSGADLLSTGGGVDIVRCTEVVWSFAGLSMASWNAVLAFALMALWLAAAAARRA